MGCDFNPGANDCGVFGALVDVVARKADVAGLTFADSH